MASELLTNVEGWYRPGGHRLDFFATRDELQDLLDVGLPPALAPWHLTGADLVPRPDQPDRYHQRPWALSEVDLATASQGPTIRPRSYFFVWSEQLTSGDLPLEPGRDYQGLCSQNGFLHLDLGHRDNLARFSPSSLSVIDRWVHWTSGEERLYPEYLRVYNRLLRLVRKRLIAPSVQTFPDGAEWINTRVKWTVGAVAAHAAGITFATGNVTCRPLEPGQPSA